MTNDVIITQAAHNQVIQLIEQLIEFSQSEDFTKIKEDPTQNTGEGFMTSKLKLIRKTLLNEI
mgnify:FL=1|tara:strand:+ start:133 stop:321 length:189 start_codon:yes stop_codon:yes gene_type:complete